MLNQNVTRRHFLRASTGAALAASAAGLLAACGVQAPAPSPTAAAAAKTAPAATTAATTATGIKVGVLNSLSGTMAISEVAVKNATLMAIDEINKAGGVLGQQLVPVIQDGASDWPTFAEKAKLLIQNEK